MAKRGEPRTGQNEDLRGFPIRIRTHYTRDGHPDEVVEEIAHTPAERSAIHKRYSSHPRRNGITEDGI